MLGAIKKIEEVHDVSVAVLGFRGYHMDGYKVETDAHTFLVLISNYQSCCESWGYLASDDDLGYFLGATLVEVRLTDKALNQEVVEESDYYEGDDGGIQFVDFITDRGTFQLAVYNAHNGYYGHTILILKDNDVLLENVL